MSDPDRAVPAPTAYSLSQIVLHWSIAALVLWQLFFSDDPPENRAGAAAQGFWTEMLTSSHLWAGFAILALVAVRIAIRLRRGPPPPVPDEGRVQAATAKVVHALFYGLLIYMPVTGILAYYFNLPLTGLHELGEPLFVGLIAIHVIASLWHQFVLRDGLFRRIIVPAG
ncbi:cytochrome b [Bauldia sp.]|uniref:cytochrome b n=1 Tax=Bauldia sp. TaxID=2575872 RepID=UPI003BABEAB2